jgi:hypothetical protein
MSKREASLKSAFFKKLFKACPNFYVLSHATRGAPDKAIYGAGRTTLWEFKHATPDFITHGDQVLFCMRLAVANHCRYVIWWETSMGTSQRTMIVHPRMIHEGKLIPDASCVGFDHDWLVDQVKRAHRL